MNEHIFYDNFFNARFRGAKVKKARFVSNGEHPVEQTKGIFVFVGEEGVGDRVIPVGCCASAAHARLFLIVRLHMSALCGRFDRCSVLVQ